MKAASVLSPLGITPDGFRQLKQKALVELSCMWIHLYVRFSEVGFKILNFLRVKGDLNCFRK